VKTRDIGGIDCGEGIVALPGSGSGAKAIKRYEVGVSRDEVMLRLSVGANTNATEPGASGSPISVLDHGKAIVLSQVGGGWQRGCRTLRLLAEPQPNGATIVDVCAPSVEWHISPVLVALVAVTFISFLTMGPVALLPCLVVSLGVDQQRRKMVRQRSLERLVFQTLAPVAQAAGCFEYRSPAAGPRRPGYPHPGSLRFG